MARAAGKVASPRRVVVLLDASGPVRAVLEAAAAQATNLGAELVAVFVEDEDLLHLSGLPFASEIGFPSAERRALDASAMQRSLQRVADEARRSIAAIAAPLSLHWSFEIARGGLSAPLLAAAADSDLVIEALRGCERAVLQLAEICRTSERARLVRARTRRELEALRHEPQRRA